MANKRYTYQDLISTYLDRERLKNAHPDLKDYYIELYRHLSAFFGVDFEKPLPASDQQREPLKRLFHSTVRQYQDASTPFAGILEAPEEIADLYQNYGKRLSELRDEVRAQCFLLLCDLYKRIYGDTGRSITSRILKGQGFDDSREPDELDFI